MCGRYTLVRLIDLPTLFPWIPELPHDLPQRYNVAPTQPILVVANDRPDRYDMFFWGLVPSWAKDPSVGQKMINARAETLADKPAFRSAYRRRRCLIPADGFYEWKKQGAAGKQPMYAQVDDGAPFAFGGLWETWHAPDGSEMRSATVITVEPNALMAPIHNRMPLIIPREDFQAWLDPAERSPEDLQHLLRPFPADRMSVRPVSRTVNSPSNQGPECIASVTEPSDEAEPGLFT